MTGWDAAFVSYLSIQLKGMNVSKRARSARVAVVVVAAGVMAFVVAVLAAAADQAAVFAAAVTVTAVCGGWLARDAWRARERSRG